MFVFNIFITFFICLTLNISSQNSIPELQKFADNSIFNLNDTICYNLSGEWEGEEVQYDATQSFIKVKFKVVFKLKQEGNRVYGTSFIQDKYRGSYGDMKIRGIVLNNKLHFEEYEIMNEKFFQLGVVWCLRSGVMDIKIDKNMAILEGLNYDGYASDTYQKCTDYAKMNIHKALNPSNILSSNNHITERKIQLDTNYFKKFDVLIFPNPCIDLSTISYDLSDNVIVKIDVFSLSGAFIQNVINESQASGKQNIKFNLSSYAPGVYLVRIIAGNLYCAKQIVKAK